jgi:hypothetical protein
MRRKLLSSNANEIVVPAESANASRRGFLKGSLSCAAFAAGFVPSARAFAQAVSLAELRRPINRALQMWLYTIHMPPEFPSTWDFGFHGAPAIPAGFFGSGSDPWIGTIACVGIPLEPQGAVPTADLVVRHEALDWVPNPVSSYGPREIPNTFRIRCEMQQLSERGLEPVLVTYNSGQRQETWDVVVTISKEHPGGGLIDITWLSPTGNSGLCDIEIAVKVDFTFTLRTPGGPGRQVGLASGIEWLSETNHPFARTADATISQRFLLSPGAQNNFLPAVRDLAGGQVEARACSKNATVSHSFSLAPRTQQPQPGVIDTFKQIPIRRE